MIDRLVVHYSMAVGLTGVLLASIHGVTSDRAGVAIATVFLLAGAIVLAIAVASDLHQIVSARDES